MYRAMGGQDNTDSRSRQGPRQAPQCGAGRPEEDPMGGKASGVCVGAEGAVAGGGALITGGADGAR